MDLVKKTMIRSTAPQIRHLINYMATHTKFAAGDYVGPLGAVQHEQQWLQLKTQLAELGPDRSIQQWKHCWRDRKKKARTEGGAVKKVQNRTGNCAAVPSISENSEIILGTIGHAMAIGVGPEESPIGQSLSQVRPSPGPATAGTSNSGATERAPPATTCNQSLSQPPPGPATAATPAGCTTGAMRSENNSTSTGAIVCQPPATRGRRKHPSDMFLKAQTENNDLLKQLVEQMKLRNNLKRDELRVQRQKLRLMRRYFQRRFMNEDENLSA